MLSVPKINLRGTRARKKKSQHGKTESARIGAHRRDSRPFVLCRRKRPARFDELLAPSCPQKLTQMIADSVHTAPVRCFESGKDMDIQPKLLNQIVTDKDQQHTTTNTSDTQHPN